jgi:hypothetical protein
MTERDSYWKPAEVMVGELNRTLRGWGNYLCLGAVSRAYPCEGSRGLSGSRRDLNSFRLCRCYEIAVQ